MENDNPGKHTHYSEHPAHHLRGEHQRLVARFGIPPESIMPGFQGLLPREAWRIRRAMRRIPGDGR